MEMIGNLSPQASISEWCKKMDIAIDNRVELFNTPSSGKGLRVIGKSVKAGTSLIRIPVNRVINADNIEEDPDIGHAIGPLRAGGLDDRGVLALWILYQSLARESIWSNYVSLLPQQYEMSRNHLLVNVESLEGTPLGASVKAMRNNISRQIRSVMRAIRKLDPPAILLSLSPGDLEQSWAWAHSVVMTRSGLLRTSEVSDWTQLPVSIVPVIDFCNHSNEPAAKIEVKDGEVQLISLRDINPGEEITISYWSLDKPLGCEQSLFSFGFLSDVNRFILPGVNFDQADSSPRKAIQRLLFLEKRGSSTDDCIYLDDLDLAVDYFTVESMSESQVLKLAKCFGKEGGIGPETQKQLSSSIVSGKLKLSHVLSRWSSEVSRCSSTVPSVSDYLQRLRSAIEQVRNEIDSHF